MNKVLATIALLVAAMLPWCSTQAAHTSTVEDALIVLEVGADDETAEAITLLVPADGEAVPAGDVAFSWTSVVGAADYQIQIDTVSSFDSVELIDETVAGTSCSHGFATLGQRYWRVRVLPEGDWSVAGRFAVAEPVVQVTNTNGDNNPALVEAADGILWLFFNSYRDNGYDYLWSQTSTDGGATWSTATAFTQIGDDDYDPAAASSDEGKLYVVWRRTEGGNNVWFRSSTDNGATWSPATRLTTDPNGDYFPDIIRASDGKLWVVWQSNRTGNDDIWYKTSTDDGATWSSDTQLTTSTESEILPTIAQAADGKLWIVWTRSGGLWYQTTVDGATWSSESEIPDTLCCDHYANLVTAQDGTLWLADERADDIWYQTSANNGVSWSTATAFTRYAGSDVMPEVVALANGQVALAWHSDRGQQWWSNVWYGVVGVNEDIDPPPSVGWIWPIPDRPVSTDTVNITVDARDESPGLSVEVVWSKDGVSQSNVPMFDDGLHGDGGAGDNRWGGTLGTFPAGTIIAHQASATDSGGNVIVHPSSPYSFQVLAPFVKAADILFVPDFEGNDTDWFRSYYTDALDVLGYAYDVWDTELRGRPGDAILGLYTGGAIIWAVPEWGYLTSDSTVRAAVQGYLDAGGKLFIAGQNIAERLSGDALLSDYLHATYVQADTGLYELAGAASDPIGDELTLSLSGGDGANNQGSKDEVDPVNPAVTAFTYQSGASNLQAAQTRPSVDRTDSEEAGRPTPAPASTPAPGAHVVHPTPQAMPRSASRSVAGETQTTLAKPQVSQAQDALSAAAPEANISSGTAGLRVDTGTYKVVYFAFGFEGINSAAKRVAVMERVLAWLNGVLPRPGLLAPGDGQVVPAGDVGFSWVSVPGATSYEIQIDTVPTFDSAGLIEETVTTTTYTHNFAALGRSYWRVRALPGENWTMVWEFRVVDDVVQVTTDPYDDSRPAMTRTTDGALWIVWSSYSDLWYKTSSDGGATWSAEMQLTTNGNGDDDPTIAQASDGKLWVVWRSDRSGNGDVWYRTTSDGGATWSAEMQLTTNGDGDDEPTIAQASDGKLWVVWRSDRSGNGDVWYRTTSDGGATWSEEMQLTIDSGSDDSPTITQASDGKLWLVWTSGRSGNPDIWYKTTSDGGETWSTETQLTTGTNSDYHSAIAQANDGTLWVVWSAADFFESNDAVLWYRTSEDGGATWAPVTSFARFTGTDECPALTPLAGGKLGLAWSSNRAGNFDIWFGIPGEREDLNPPPYVSYLLQFPSSIPDSDDTTFRAWVTDEIGLASVDLIWTLDTVVQDDMPMYNDGAHDDFGAGDMVWGCQLAALPAGSQVTYRARATDIDGNTYLYPYEKSFTVLVPFAKTADILFVPDYGGNSTTWFQPYYTNALDALGYTYDVWDTGLRGEPPAAVLSQYSAGAIIWAVPYWGYASYGWYASDDNLRAYLDLGGNLLISGQNLAQGLSSSSGTDFLNGYLHAGYVQDDTGLYGLSGVTGDPIGDGLALNLSGGDGANNQYSKDEIDPIGPAVAAFIYQTGASAMLKEPVRSVQEAPNGDAAPAGWLVDPGGVPSQGDEAVEHAALEANISSGTAGLRVDTGTYKVVYLAFGFEGINSAADRNTVMVRVLGWLGVPPPPAVDLGQPGLSYRYVKTYGETRVPYLADNDHLFRPWGVTVDSSSNVYVTEGSGHRMMKFTADGDFLMSIGQGGDWLANNTNRINVPRGVAVDAGGNIWIAEGGSHRVSKWDATGKYMSQLGQTWNPGSDNDRFRWPSGIAFDAAGRLYIVDDDNQRIQIFDSGGDYSATLGIGTCGPANDQFCDPQGVAVDSAGRLYVADQGNERVQIFDASFNYLATLGLTGTCGQANNLLCDPSDVEIGPDGKVYVSDSRNNRVQIFAPYPALSYVATIGVTGQWGSDNAHFGWPIGVAVDTGGNIYVVEEDNSRVQKFDSAHNYVQTFGVTGVPYLTDNLHFTKPTDAAVDVEGNLIVLEQDGQRFVKLDPNGTPLFAVGSPGNPSWSQSGFCRPAAIATDGVGRIYVTDTCSNRIQIYDSEGVYLATIGTGYGTGNDQLKSPLGLVVGADGYIYVADTDNHRIQVFDSSYNYLATIGQTGVAGTDNAHFNRPLRPALDQAGNLYVADANNYRVQKCTPAGVCTIFAGVTGESGNDFNHFSEPDGVAVDKQGRVYVVDQHNGRVQVYDQNGAYLTTLGGSRGTLTGQNQNPVAVEADADGNVYIVDIGNQRVQKFSPGVPGWQQVNINGFGDRWPYRALSTASINGALHLGTGWRSAGAGVGGGQLWRFEDGQWMLASNDGLGDARNAGIETLREFQGELYAGTTVWPIDGGPNGGQIWRSGNGTDWERVVESGFGSQTNDVIQRVTTFNNMLYAGTLTYASTVGSEIWRSASGDPGAWEQVMANGFGDRTNYGIRALEVYGGHLYAGTTNLDLDTNTSNGAEIWRTSDGSNWTQVAATQFDTPDNTYVDALTGFDGHLYAYSSAGQVWQCQVCAGNDWEQVLNASSVIPDSLGLGALEVYAGKLYAFITNYRTGLVIFRTADGAQWEPYGLPGFGNSNNVGPYGDGSVVVHNGHLFVGAYNSASGLSVWQKTLTADFTATPTRGAPSLTVQFTNTSAGDFTTSQWDFGDGGTSTELNPTHVYAQVGTYEVTLAVGDGTETSTATKPAYIVAAYADGITVDGACTLADAITAANTDTDTGGCTGGSGADTIVLTVDVTLTATDNSTLGATGLPVVTSEITIAGNNHTISRSSANEFRILAVDGAGNLTLQSTTISGGAAQTSGTTDEMSGGGIFNAGTLTVQNSAISGNSAGSSGDGGGIYNLEGTLAVQNSAISGNTGYFGGGIENWKGTATVENSTISGNSVYSGGGIFNREGPLTVENSTISGNSGGGIFVWGALAVQNSIVAAQTNGVDCELAMATVVSEGYNIESGTTCGFTGAGDQQNTDPLLDALANNGGPTQTMALHAGSPAIDMIAAGTNGCVAGASPDQRGATRASGADGSGTACDIGAYEFETLDITLDGVISTFGDKVTLSWNPLTASKVQVWRSNSPFSGFTLLRDDVTTTSVEVSIDPNTNYYYGVRALGAFGGDPLAVSPTIGVFSFGLAPGAQ